jgi:L-seryl-tRNA(Ser) seleniumtransferase
MDSLLQAAGAAEALALYGRLALKEELRRAIASGETGPDALLDRAKKSLARRFAPTLARAINATGVLLHTNLGRSPLSHFAADALEQVSSGYATLEYDPATGERGRRQDHIRTAARDLFACEDALAVNNNAAAVFLALCALARGKRVLVSRGELVAIGGSFRIPEILESSGAELQEVGTTNRTSIDDYRRALSPSVGLLLTVHPSNYEIRGYTERPQPRELVEFARDAGLPWVHDQGTGCVEPLEEFGVAGEPTVASCLADGASLVTFSADKLFGGPQAGFAVGEASLIARLLSHPVARVVRPDKLTLAALAATLAAWKTGKWREMPIYRAAGEPLSRLEERGESIRNCLDRRPAGFSIEVVPSAALFGGGTSPEKRFGSRALALSHRTLDAPDLLARLRLGEPPIVGRIEEGRVLLDLRTIAPEEDAAVAETLLALAETP